MHLRAPVLVLLWIAVSSSGLAASSEKARIEALQARDAGDEIRLSFRLADAFDEQTTERIESGLPTSFRYQIRLERQHRWWFDNTLAKSELQVTAMYNAVTREYLVNYKLDGKLYQSRVVTSRDDLAAAMTRLEDIPFPAADREADGRISIQVRAALGSKTVLAIIPTTVHTSWSAVPRPGVAPGRSPATTAQPRLRW